MDRGARVLHVTHSQPELRLSTPFVGAGGGVGTSTLCRWLGDPAVDGGTTAPEWTGRPIVVVASGTTSSLAAVGRLAAALTDRPLSVRLVLAVIADSAAPEPGLVRSRVRALGATVVGAVRFPYVEAWRYVDDPLSRPVPAAYQRSLRSLCRLVHLS